MQGVDLFRLYTDRFDAAGIRYMVTGSVASIAYGEPRLTHDVDLVIELRADRVDPLVAAFPLLEFYCPPEEIIRAEMARNLRGHFNLIHHETGYKADIYIAGEDSLHRWAFPRRRQILLSDKPVWLAPPEYVILRKLEFFREGGSEKHLRDIASILQISREILDEGELGRLVSERGLVSEWNAALVKARE